MIYHHTGLIYIQLKNEKSLLNYKNNISAAAGAKYIFRQEEGGILPPQVHGEVAREIVLST